MEMPRADDFVHAPPATLDTPATFTFFAMLFFFFYAFLRRDGRRPPSRFTSCHRRRDAAMATDDAATMSADMLHCHAARCCRQLAAFDAMLMLLLIFSPLMLLPPFRRLICRAATLDAAEALRFRHAMTPRH